MMTANKILHARMKLRLEETKVKLQGKLEHAKARIERALRSLKEGEELEETVVQNMMGITGTIVRYNLALEILPYVEEKA